MSRTRLFVILPLVIFAPGCSRNETHLPLDDEHVHTEASAEDDVVRLSEAVCVAVGIRVEEVKSRQCRSLLRVMGKVLAPPQQTAIVSHAVPARVAAIQAKVGDWVEEGQALLTLDSNQVGDAKAAFYQAVADWELAQINLDRQKKLLENGIGVKKNYLAAETDARIAQSKTEAAEKTLHVLGFTEEQVREISDTHQIHPSITVYSPITGKVVKSNAVQGAMVDQTTQIMTIIDVRRLWAAAEVYEKDIAKVKVGQTVEITVPAYPETVFYGELSNIRDVVDEETRTITVMADVPNDDQRLKPGMFADATIQLDETCEELAVPLAAILEEGHQKAVFVKQDDCFVRRVVETGIFEGDYQQIVKGLKAGEEVVVQGNHELRSKLREDILHGAHSH